MKKHVIIITARSSSRTKAAAKVRELCERRLEEGGGYIEGINKNNTLRAEFVAMEWIGKNGWNGYPQLHELRNPDAMAAPKATIQTLQRDNERLRERTRTAERSASLASQSIEEVRAIIAKGGTTADVMAFLEKTARA